MRIQGQLEQSTNLNFIINDKNGWLCAHRSVCINLNLALQRETNRERCSSARRVFHNDCPVMRLNKRMDDRKAKADSSGSRSGDAVEFFENPVQGLLRKSRTFIGN